MRARAGGDRRRPATIGGLVVGVLVAACSACGASGDAAAPATTQADAGFGGWTAAAVQDVTEVAPYDGAVAARVSLALSSTASGTVTRSSAVGTALQPGDLWLYVDEKPVTVMAGDIPAFRDLIAPGAGQPPLQGEDVRQLQRFLAAAGVFSGSVNGTFSDSLGRAAARWRTRHAMPEAAGFARSEIAFLPGSGPWTVTEVTAHVGDVFGGGKALSVSSGEMAVTVQLDTEPPDGAAYVLVPAAGATGQDVALTPTGPATVTPDGKYALQLTPPDATAGLTPGTSVVVEQRVVLASQVVAVPVAAVRVDAAGKTYVECREVDARGKRCPVSLGPTNGTEVAVTDGLAAGAQVATTP